MSTRRIGSSSIGGGGGGSNVRYQTDETPGTVVGELWVDSDGTSSLVNSNDYLTKVDASAEYLSKISASATYLTQDSASATYATQTSLTDGLASKLDLAGGKILQIVRATDGTSRTTTSTSFVDASISVTITPEKSDSAILLIYTANVDLSRGSSGRNLGAMQISDSSNNGISGADIFDLEVNASTDVRIPMVLVGYSTPATTSATTYKGRFIAGTGTTVTLLNGNVVSQLYAIEVSA